MLKKDLEKCNIYIGITSRLSLSHRLAEHATQHENIDGEELMKYETLAAICYAEFVGIKYVRELVTSKKILSC